HDHKSSTAPKKAVDIRAGMRKSRAIARTAPYEHVDLGKISLRQVAYVDRLVETVAIAWPAQGVVVVVGSAIHGGEVHGHGRSPKAQSISCGTILAAVVSG